MEVAAALLHGDSHRVGFAGPVEVVVTQLQNAILLFLMIIMEILMLPVTVAIVTVCTIKTMMEDRHDKPALNWKQLLPGICMSAGIWVVLIMLGYLFIRWAAR